MIRSIIKEETKRMIREGVDDAGMMDPVGLVEMYMTRIEDVIKSRRGSASGREVSELIEDLCAQLKDAMYDWTLDRYRSDGN
jgi:hypothetical protein